MGLAPVSSGCSSTLRWRPLGFLPSVTGVCNTFLQHVALVLMAFYDS